MELLLVLLVGGILILFLRPLGDWYVVDLRDGSGLSVEKALFTDADAAQQAFNHARERRAGTASAATVQLWHAEVRSRREALKATSGENGSARLLKSADL